MTAYLDQRDLGDESDFVPPTQRAALATWLSLPAYRRDEWLEAPLPEPPEDDWTAEQVITVCSRMANVGLLGNYDVLGGGPFFCYACGNTGMQNDVEPCQACQEETWDWRAGGF